MSYRENAIFCPACGAAMQERSTEEALIDVCPECGGIYLDWFDGEPAAALRGWAPTHDPNQAPIQSLKGLCPKCGGGLDGEELPGTGAIIFRCIGCSGFFATEPAAKMIAGHTEPLPSDAPDFLRGARDLVAIDLPCVKILLRESAMTVHVSIHDVSPAWDREIEIALEMCHAVGATPALLVVPNFHGASSLDDAPKFQDKLRALQASGHEIILHGFFHASRDRDAARPSGTGRPSGLRWLFAQKIASGGEAEFSDVTREEAETRLADGEAMLARAGLSPSGFIPPAWSMPPWLLPMLGARGYRFSEDHLFAYDPKHEKKRASVVLNYASRTPGRLLSSAAWCRIAKHVRAAMPARIAIHPADMNYSLLRREVKSLLEWGKGDFVGTTQALFS